jgi:hypothetical protein
VREAEREVGYNIFGDTNEQPEGMYYLRQKSSGEQAENWETGNGRWHEDAGKLMKPI